MFDFEKHRDESDPKILEKWSSKLQIAQNERLRMISQNEYNYNKTHQKYVDSQLKYFKMEVLF